MFFIHPPFLKEFSELFADFLYQYFNTCLDSANFPLNTEIRRSCPHTQKSKKDQINYKPVIILSNVSKVYVGCMLEQMSHYFVNPLSKCQCGFQQSFSAQQYMSILIEKGRKTRDLKGAFTTV